MQYCNLKFRDNKSISWRQKHTSLPIQFSILKKLKNIPQIYLNDWRAILLWEYLGTNSYKYQFLFYPTATSVQWENIRFAPGVC